MIDFELIHRIARRRALKCRGGIVEAGDLENEAIVAALSGWRSIDGPISDFLRKQGMVGQHRNRRANPVRASFYHSDGSEREALWIDRSHRDSSIARATVDGLLPNLTAQQREAIELRYFEGMLEGEIAGRLHISVDCVRSRHARALIRLRKMITPKLAA